MTGRIACFRRANRGNSAVEFALILPLLAILLVGIVDIGRYAYQRTDMFGAVRAGAQYLMAGGSNEVTTEAIVTRSWSQAPADGTVSVDEFCLCGGEVVMCNALCADDEAPDAYTRIVVSGTYRGIFMSLANEASETVRVR